MIRNLIPVAFMLAPTGAFAHSDENAHASMSITRELVHMLGDPLHLIVIAMIALTGAFIWKFAIALKISGKKA